MAYIGKQPVIGNFQKCDAISVVNGQAAYTLQVGGSNVSPQSENHMLVSLNGILQSPTDSFTVSGSTITFASALSTGDVIDFVMILGNVLDLGVPSDNTVSLAKLTATGTKDSTTFLRGDNTFASAGVSQETGTWTSTINYSTNLSNTSPDATGTVTGNYIKTGKFYFCSIPLIKAETLGLSASTDFLFFNWTTPATTSADNSSHSVVAGYNLSGRYSGTDFTDGYLFQELGSSDTTVSLTFKRTTVNGTGFCKVNNTNTGNARCSIAFWTD